MNIPEDIKKELKSLKEQSGVDFDPSRFGVIDIAYPTSAEEFISLGSHAIAMVIAISDNKKELPIERAYFRLRDQKIITMNKIKFSVKNVLLADRVKEGKDDNEKIYFENVSFWAIPVGWLIDDKGYFAIDFKGERKEFRFTIKFNLQSWLRECIDKQIKKEIKVADHVSYDTLAKFINREFIKNNGVKL